MATKTYKEVFEQMASNDPPIEINQIWIVKNEEGKILRKLRILAEYPYDREKTWIYEELPSKMNRMGIRRMGTCPEFNLRYVFELEGMYNA
jgi:hypothetical protein